MQWRLPIAGYPKIHIRAKLKQQIDHLQIVISNRLIEQRFLVDGYINQVWFHVQQLPHQRRLIFLHRAVHRHRRGNIRQGESSEDLRLPNVHETSVLILLAQNTDSERVAQVLFEVVYRNRPAGSPVHDVPLVALAAVAFFHLEQIERFV